MAITPVPFPRLTFEDALQVAKTTAGLSGQSRNEVYECLDMVQIWQDWLKNTFGSITGINHRSRPDDPPDLELTFEGGRVVGMEHTKLLPQHVGEAEAWLRKSGQGGGLPSISSPPTDKDELRDIVAGIKPAWSNVVDDWKTIFDLLVITLRKKMLGMPSGGVIGIVYDLFINEEYHHQMAEMAHDIVNRVGFPDFTNYTLVLLDRPNPSQFYSALIRRSDVLEQRGVPPPLSEDDKKLLSEMEALTAELDPTEN